MDGGMYLKKDVVGGMYLNSYMLVHLIVFAGEYINLWFGIKCSDIGHEYVPMDLYPISNSPNHRGKTDQDQDQGV